MIFEEKANKYSNKQIIKRLVGLIEISRKN